MRSLRRAGFALCIMFGGCAIGATVGSDPAYRAERGLSSVLVIESPRGPQLSSPSREVARLMATELGLRWFNVLDREVLVRTFPDLESLLAQVARRLALGQSMQDTLSERLAREYGVGQILLVDLFRHEQFWGRETRITRVGVEARLVRLVDGRTLWQGRYEPEVSDAPGSGFETAARRAVGELVRLLSDEWPRFKDTPMASWYVLELFAPN
jgi:hypothetical protein